MGNPEVKTEILAKNNHGKPVNRFSRVGWFGVSFFILPLALLLGPSSSIAHSHYLFVWAMEVSHPEAKTIDELKVGLGKDFLAAFDVAPNASPFGKLVAMLPVGEAELAHHTNYALPPNDVLYANDRMGNSTYVFDLRDGSHPGLLRKFGNVGVYGFPHSFVPLSNGHEVATFQYSGGFNKAPGGLVEFDTDGRIVRSSSAADPQVDPNIRPYSLAVIPKLDRVVTGSADMMGAQVSHAVQIWRLSDLKLLNTIALPARAPLASYSDDPSDSSEPRVLADGATVVVPTFHCGLFLVRNLASDHPTLQHIYDFGYRTCEVPVVVGDYWVETMQSGHAIVSLDMHDPEHPHEASRILLKPDQDPHWLAVEPNSDRLVITGYGALFTHALFATIDRQTGKLTLTPQSIDFTRDWPDGWKGSALPHGAVFSNR